MKYPIGIQSFDQLIEDNYVYIDKTDMVYSLAKERRKDILFEPSTPFRKESSYFDVEELFLGQERIVQRIED